MIEIVKLFAVALYVTGMLLICEAFLTVGAAFEVFARKKKIASDMLFGSSIPKYRFMVIIGSAGFLVFGFLYLYKIASPYSQPTGYIKAIGEIVIFIGNLLIFYGLRGFMKRIKETKKTGGKNAK